jgi:hypothetical protein
MTMSNPDYSSLVERQPEYFISGSTRPARRKAGLEALKALFTENHNELCAALWKDLRRNVIDADLMDVAYNVKEVNSRPRPLGLYVLTEDLGVRRTPSTSSNARSNAG